MGDSHSRMKQLPPFQFCCRMGSSGRRLRCRRRGHHPAPMCRPYAWLSQPPSRCSCRSACSRRTTEVRSGLQLFAGLQAAACFLGPGGATAQGNAHLGICAGVALAPVLRLLRTAGHSAGAFCCSLHAPFKWGDGVRWTRESRPNFYTGRRAFRRHDRTAPQLCSRRPPRRAAAVHCFQGRAAAPGQPAPRAGAAAPAVGRGESGFFSPGVSPAQGGALSCAAWLGLAAHAHGICMLQLCVVLCHAMPCHALRAALCCAAAWTTRWTT